MNFTIVYVMALGIGVIAGLRSMTAPAVVAWAAHLNRLVLFGTRLSFLASPVTVGIVTLLAVGELIADKLPATPSRTSAVPLSGRVLTGGLCGAAICAGWGASVAIGTALGAVGGVAGAFGPALAGAQHEATGWGRGGCGRSDCHRRRTVTCLPVLVCAIREFLPA